MWHGHDTWSAWPMLTGGLLFWASLISLVALGFHRSTRQSEGATTYGKPSLDYLAEQYKEGRGARSSSRRESEISLNRTSGIIHIVRTGG